MPDVSYLITYRNSDPARHRNLEHVLSSLSGQPDIEVILIEQDIKSHCNQATLPGRVRHLFVYNPGLFNKSWGLNLAAGLASTQKLIFADADMLLTEESYTQIKAQLNAGVDAINPYTELVDLSEDETEAFLTGLDYLSIERTEAQLNRKELGQCPPFCGGVFATSRSLYLKCGGFDERFTGWGAEDDAMSMRLIHVAKQAVTLSGQYAYHLWHPSVRDTRAQRAAYLRNLARLSPYHEYGRQFYTDIAHMDAKHNANKNKFIKQNSTASERNERPLISCLCVTRMRVDALKQAIDCFQQQSYPNRELLILFEDDDQQSNGLIQSLNDPQIRGHCVPIQPKLTLGELRNCAIDVAKGDYICQWDDDDWYHPRRLELQFQALLRQNKSACLLSRWLIYSRLDNKAYCSNLRLWEGSLMCHRALMLSGPGYPAMSKGEDTALIAWLYVQDRLAIEDRPDLYVYMHSGNNTWGNQHFRKILDASSTLDRRDTEHLRRMLKILPNETSVN